MSSPFIVTAPTPETPEAPIQSSAFWPTVDPVAVREAQRIDNTITPTRLRETLIEAIAVTNTALRTWREGQQAAGTEKLSDVSADKIDNTSILVHRYLRAVGSYAKAQLLERIKDFDATGKGDRKADSLIDPIDDCRRDHLNAIADIIGTPRTTVELI